MSDLLPWQERVVEEAKQLSVRLDKLRYIMNTPRYQTFPVAERYLLREQLVHMELYLATLNSRIERFGIQREV